MAYTMGCHVVRAISGINMFVPQGSYISILGPSGSGKSTLMHIIGMMEKPTSGDVTYDGRRHTEFTERERAAFRNRKIGFLFQAFNLLPRQNVLQNVMLPTLYGDGDAGAHARAIAILERLNLADRKDHRPSQLSGGEKQRVSLARALVNAPMLIVADEPTGNLDGESSAEVARLLEEEVEKMHTVIVVTHNVDLARRARTTLHLNGGKLR